MIIGLVLFFYAYTLVFIFPDKNIISCIGVRIVFASCSYTMAMKRDNRYSQSLLTCNPSLSSANKTKIKSLETSFEKVIMISVRQNKNKRRKSTGAKPFAIIVWALKWGNKKIRSLLSASDIKTCLLTKSEKRGGGIKKRCNFKELTRKSAQPLVT